ncbi:Transcriptional regulator of ribosomal biogenesis proteins [Coemansia sp. RSA 2610]|nr:Transcriptional regulator of ribosomal biogenesis proteins [Coemansia sp. RSA 2705]KAJ2360175.1 Transcriptional regulator of ribosomal biogenesis proteins [Coemansia sp. RSA 2610]
MASRRHFDLSIGPASMGDDDFYYPRALEATFCRDFSCCGLILNDLHDLLQHYEECHVRFEEDEAPADMGDGCFFGDEWAGDLPFGMALEQQLMLDAPEPAARASARATPQLSPSETAASSVISSPLESALPFPDAPSRKRPAPASAAASPADRVPALKRQATCDSDAAKALPGSVLGLYDDDIIAAIASATNPLFLSAGSDKSLPAGVTNASLAQAASAAVVAVSGDDFEDEVHLPPSVTAAMAGAVAAAAAAKAHGLLPRDDKPYRCPVQGCDKAYKNPNGLKYHNLHGHCNMAEDMHNASKPYKCRVPECYKAYKNLNGLKYHVQHAHCSMIPSLRDLPANATPAEVAAAVAAAAAAAAATAAASSAAPSPAASAPASPTRSPVSAPVSAARAPPRPTPFSAGPAPLPRTASAPSTPLRAHGPPQRLPLMQRPGARPNQPPPVRRPGPPHPHSASGPRPRVLPPPAVRRPPTAPSPAPRQPQPQQQQQATAATC